MRVVHFDLFVCLSVCLSVRTRNSKTTAPIDLILYTIYTTSSKMNRIGIWTQNIYLRILHHWEVGQDMTS